MFRPKKARLINSTAPIITAKYFVLLAEDEFHPILFIGENGMGQRVIGSSVEWDKLRRVERYFQVCDDEEMALYFNGAKSYREMLEDARPLYVVDRKSSEEYCVYSYLLSEISQDYWPAQDTYYNPAWGERP